MPFGQTTIKLDTSKLDQILGQIDPRAEAILEKGARDIESGWKQWIIQKKVIDTGAYLSSIHVRREHKPLQREIADGIEYGIYQEYGTVRMPARPCAQPAVDAVKPGLQAAWKAVLEV